MIWKKNLIELVLEDSINTSEVGETMEKFIRIMHLDNIQMLKFDTDSTNSSDKRVSIKFKSTNEKITIYDIEEIFPEWKFITIVTWCSRIYIPMKNVSYYDIY